ncbi:MAG: T9SS type A sorting domain-containing protein [Bacteroidetes bacterium]|nr:T9SS type A sorting domain-containing protein [Bacteroidota bacterium]
MANKLSPIQFCVSELTAQVVSTDVSCNGGHNGSATITPAGSGPFDIIWVPGEMQNAHVTHLLAGTYTVNATNAAGCSVSQYITIDEPPALTISISSQNATCSGQTGSAVCTVGGGTPQYTYSWNTTPPQNTSSISNLIADVYTVNVTDDHNCQITDSVEILGAAGFTASIQTTPATCLATDGSVSTQVSGGSGDFSYVWNPSVSTGSDATGLAAGVYSVTITDNVGGCQQTLSGIVGNTAGIVATIVSSSDATCSNGEDGSATASGSGGTPPYSYLWTPGGDTSATVTDLAPGTYTVQVSDYLGCPDYATVTIGYHFLSPTVDLGADTLICNGTVLTLDAGPGYQYLWSDNSTGQTLTVTSSGIYSVLVTDGNGCEGFDAISVDTITCNPHYSTALSNSGFEVFPNPSSGDVSLTFNNQHAGEVQITVIDAVGKLHYSASENLKAYSVRNLDLKNLSEGIYFIKVTFEGNSSVVRWVKM